MLVRIIDTRKYLKIKYDIRQFVGIGLALAICTYMFYLDNKVISVIFLPVFLLVAIFFNRETVNVAIRSIEKKVAGKVNKKIFIAIVSVIIVAIVGIGGLYVYKKAIASPKAIQTQIKEKIKEIKAEDIVIFSRFGSEDFTCTGLSYDAKDDAFWISDYGAMYPDDHASPRIVEVDRNLEKVIKSINLNMVLASSANLQGVAYDSKEDCLWLAVGEFAVAISKDGILTKSIPLGKYSMYKSNGICYDVADDSLWVLCASQYLLHLEKDGSMIQEFVFNYSDQDHICLDDKFLYITVGADYQGNNNYVCKLSKQDGSIVALYRLLNASAIEGICLADNKIMIANDGFYHNDLIGHSYISVYSVEQFK